MHHPQTASQKQPLIHEYASSQDTLQQQADQRRYGLDIGTTVILFSVWGSLAISSAVLLYFTHVSTSLSSTSDTIITPDSVAGTVALTAIPLLVATILNEILIERCWRRVVYLALGTKGYQQSNHALARRLRAANFEPWTFFKRACRSKATGREWISAICYALLRWGTTVSITTVQLSITWKSQGPGYYAVKKYGWLFLPLILHGICIFGSITIWFVPPWRFFSNRYNDEGLLRKYSPYLNRVQGGSLCTATSVARHLESYGNITGYFGDLTRKNTAGRQILIKLRGLWFGLLFMFLAPGVAWVVCRFSRFPDLLNLGETRMAVHFIFLAQNIFYLMALEFAVWNVALDGLCRTEKGKPKRLHFLGYSSGIMLLFKAIRQRRPVRASLFLLLFWSQACIMRALTVLYALCATILSYDNVEQMQDFRDPDFWLAWVAISALVTFPLFIIWLFTMTDAPVCSTCGWRWAQIAKTAIYEEGYYGVRGKQATWGRDVEPFRSHANEWLR